MATKIGINGFGRIGRLTLRTINQYHRERLEVVAVNDLTDAQTNAHLFKWDTTYGRYPGAIEARDGALIVDGCNIKVIAEKDPANIPWKELGVDVVIESTGLFTDANKAKAHFAGGAKKIIISAPAKNEDITLVLGVNQDKYDPTKHHIISNASCTTNGLAPVAKVLNDNFGIQKAVMSTVHAYTNDQRLQDMFHKDLRRARAACENIVPTSTGAAHAIGLVLPELSGKMHGIAFRIPTATVSLIDLVAVVNCDVTKDEINAAFKTASEGALKGILEYVTEDLVSNDFKGTTFSACFDAPSTIVIGGNLIKVLTWYDNEWGYACRLADLAAFVAQKGL
ncbi:MAG: type I glyceraldehyde-3-phosphate dehydrogenase [Dehalococcoidia bacterium]|nr:type I glyceraldehyde-3-phosphate dehydrogenase [Dehalococcoidia bacterium]